RVGGGADRRLQRLQRLQGPAEGAPVEERRLDRVELRAEVHLRRTGWRVGPGELLAVPAHHRLARPAAGAAQDNLRTRAAPDPRHAHVAGRRGEGERGRARQVEELIALDWIGLAENSLCR